MPLVKTLLDLGYIWVYGFGMLSVSENISVNLVFDSKKMQVYPKAVIWKNKKYQIEKVGLHHKYKKGNTLFHVFSVISGDLFLRLILDTKTLHWKLEEIEMVHD